MVTEQLCCYWNITAPGNYSDCHVSHNGTVVLTCEVYAPRDSNKNSLATVKWYRRIESVVEDITDRYENSTMQINFSNTSINGLFEDRYQLIIRSINSSNNSGVYWCQLSADRFCFIPSVYVNITVNTSLNGSDCSEFKYHQSQVCAVDNSSSCQVISTSSINTMSSTPPVMTSQLNLCHGKLELKKLRICSLSWSDGTSCRIHTHTDDHSDLLCWNLYMLEKENKKKR